MHLCFTQSFASSQKKEQAFKSILAQPKLAKKLKTLMECNIDFNVWEDNIVSLKVGGGPDNKITLQDLFFCDTKSSRTKMQV